MEPSLRVDGRETSLAGKAADDRILHLDLHFQNIITARGPVVIDWRNAAEGPAGLDIAMSAMILAQVAVDDAHPLAGEFLLRALTASNRRSREALLLRW